MKFDGQQGCLVSIETNDESVELVAVEGIEDTDQVRVLIESAEYLRQLADRIETLANYQGARFNCKVQTALNRGKALPAVKSE